MHFAPHDGAAGSAADPAADIIFTGKGNEGWFDHAAGILTA